MKEQKAKQRKGFLNKLFIKFCRIFGYEIIDQSNFSELKASDLMNRNPLTALENDNLQLAENRMREAKVQCLIVKNQINEVVGVIQIFE